MQSGSDWGKRDEWANIRRGYRPHLRHSYGTRLVPRVPLDMAAFTAVGTPRSVLETACGTGIVTRALRAALPSDVTITATDFSNDMLAVAREKFGNGVVFQQADGVALPFPNDLFDAVVCQFGMMFFPDKQKGLQEAFRVLAWVADICSASGTNIGSIRLAACSMKAPPACPPPIHLASIRFPSATPGSTKFEHRSRKSGSENRRFGHTGRPRNHRLNSAGAWRCFWKPIVLAAS